MSEIRFIVPAVPVAQPRPKATAVNGRARVYGAPAKHPVHAFKATCRMAWEAAEDAHTTEHGDEPEEFWKPWWETSARAIELTFVMPRPKLPKKMGTGRLLHTKRPDFDNLEKSVTDALNGLAWLDDSCLCDVHTRKFVAAADEAPHVEIVIRPA